jgi:hypothetical protein
LASTATNDKIVAALQQEQRGSNEVRERDNAEKDGHQKKCSGVLSGLDEPTVLMRRSVSIHRQATF